MQVQQLIRRQEDKEKKYIKLQSRGLKQQKFQFKTYQLSLTIREILYEKIIQFDANGDKKFQQQEIKRFLIDILHQKQAEIHYFIKNVFRYDTNNDGTIEYDELVNFCMEQHLGQIAIQRLHRQKTYQKGSQRLMSEEQFIKTINYAISFLQSNINTSQLQQLFKSVDIDNDGDISYEDYFRFLKEYFGSKSYAARIVNSNTVEEELKRSRELPNGRKESDILKKYSKYDNEGSDINQKGGNIDNKNNLTNSIRSSIINQPSSTPKNQNTLNNSQISNNSNRSSGINTLLINNINNPSTQIKKQAQNSQNDFSSERKGIDITLNNKQQNKINKQVILSQQDRAVSSKIARIVLSQLKVSIISYDINKLLKLSQEELCKYITSTLNINEASFNLIKRGVLTKQKKYSYDEAVKIVIHQHILKIFSQANINDWSKAVEIEDFIKILQKICKIIAYTPLHIKFEDLYRSRLLKLGSMNYNDFQSLVVHIFINYPYRP